jgi:uncharacterized protein
VLSVEVRLRGVACNIACRYCYQEAERAAQRPARNGLEPVFRALERNGGPFTVFGGEPLAAPKDTLRQLWQWGLDRHGSNGVQTNGVLIDDEYLEMFRAYKVDVGISIDGPGELNDARWAGSLERTRSATARTEAAIAALCARGTPPSLIVTLSRGNVAADRLPRWLAWLRSLVASGVTSIRLHLLEVDSEHARVELALSDDEAFNALAGALDLSRECGVSFDVFSDIDALLRGRDDHVTCVWRACDPLTTPAVQGIEGDGSASNCGRVNKEGVGFGKAARRGYERYIALYQTPQEHGGCQDCRFFLACRGHCPGTAIDGDWRNRTEHCGVLKRLFALFEDRLRAEGVEPVSLSPRRREIEQKTVLAWSRGLNLSIREAFDTARTP